MSLFQKLFDAKRDFLTIIFVLSFFSILAQPSGAFASSSGSVVVNTAFDFTNYSYFLNNKGCSAPFSSSYGLVKLCLPQESTPNNRYYGLYDVSDLEPVSLSSPGFLNGQYDSFVSNSFQLISTDFSSFIFSIFSGAKVILLFLIVLLSVNYIFVSIKKWLRVSDGGGVRSWSTSVGSDGYMHSVSSDGVRDESFSDWEKRTRL